jgi:hypothetical protein
MRDSESELARRRDTLSSVVSRMANPMGLGIVVALEDA